MWYCYVYHVSCQSSYASEYKCLGELDAQRALAIAIAGHCNLCTIVSDKAAMPLLKMIGLGYTNITLALLELVYKHDDPTQLQQVSMTILYQTTFQHFVH